MVRIAFAGKMGSGKTTRAVYLVKRYGFIKLSFAHNVYNFAERIFGNHDRKTLQFFGEMCREYDPECWIKLLDKELRKYPDKDVVIDDCRYPNEAKYLFEHGFIIIMLVCDEKERIRRVKELGKYYEGCENNPSEKSVDAIPTEYIYDVWDTSGDLNYGILDGFVREIRMRDKSCSNCVYYREDGKVIGKGGMCDKRGLNRIVFAYNVCDEWRDRNETTNI